MGIAHILFSEVQLKVLQGEFGIQSLKGFSISHSYSLKIWKMTLENLVAYGEAKEFHTDSARTE